MQDVFKLCRLEGAWHTRTDVFLIRQDIGHALDFLHLRDHVLHVPGRHFVVHEHEVRGVHVEFFLHLCRALHAGHVFGQRGGQVIVLSHIGLGIDCRDEQQDEHRDDGLVVLCDKDRCFLDRTDQHRVFPLVEEHDQRRKHQNRADDTQDYALGHDQADVLSQRQAHEAQGQEPGNRGDGRRGDGHERRLNGRRHGFLVCHARLRLFLLVPVEKEDGIVHRHRQLQDQRQGFGDVGNLPQENIGSHVVDDRERDTQQEHEGCHPGLQPQTQDHQTQRHGNGRVNRGLCRDQVPGVLGNGRESCQPAVHL